ncbi:MAG: SBBP repeat-containing protein [Bacteroidota bacterium]
MLRILSLLILLTSGFCCHSADAFYAAKPASKALAMLNQRAMAASVPVKNTADNFTGSKNIGKNASLLFIENKGQIINSNHKPMPEILFSAKSGGLGVYVTNNAIHYVFSKTEGKPKAALINNGTRASDLDERLREFENLRTGTCRMSLELQGANMNPRVLNEQPNAYYENYYLPQCPKGIKAQAFERIRIKNVYPGIDWVIYSNGQGLKYDFMLSPGADAAQIKLRVKDADTEINTSGELLMKTVLGEIKEHKPVSMQGGKNLETAFIKNRDGSFGFQVTGAVRNRALVIDPTVDWSTYYSGSWDSAEGVDTDAEGNVYFVGVVIGNDFPVLAAFQTSHYGFQNPYLVKMSPAGTPLWATYYGGSDTDWGVCCTVDAGGGVYFSGQTNSYDFPVANALQSTYAGNSDAYIVKFNTNGARVWATFYGGSARDYGTTCTADAYGNVYLSGRTGSEPLSLNRAFQSIYGGGESDAFLVKFSGAGSKIWATYYGGSGDESTMECTTDREGNVFMTGYTTSADLPLFNSLQDSARGYMDAYIAKFDSTGNRLWASRFGGSGYEIPHCCSTDVAGNVFFAGVTDSPDFPVQNAFQSKHGGLDDAFLMKLNGDGLVQWATYYGGSQNEHFRGCGSDSAGNIFVAGMASDSTPVFNAFQIRYAGKYDAFAAKFTGGGNRLWATYFGGDSLESDISCTVDLHGNLIMTGCTESPNLPVRNAFRETHIDYQNTFAAKFYDCSIPFTGNISLSGPGALCSGGSLTLTSPAARGNLWSNGDTTRSITVNEAGQYQLSIVSGRCTTEPSNPVIVTLNANSATAVTDSFCLGTAYNFEGRLLQTPGTYYYTGTNIAGCDSLITLTLLQSIMPPVPVIQFRNDTLFTDSPGISYQWLNENGPIDSADSSFYVPQVAGEYRLVITNASGCKNESLPYLAAGAQAQAVSAAGWRIYPNPAGSTLSISGMAYGTQVYIQTPLAQTVFSGAYDGKSLNIEHLPAGLYFLSTEGSGMTRFVKSGAVTTR